MARRRAFSWTTLGVVVVGGALGVSVRAAMVLPWGSAAHPLVVPSITLVINVVGSFLLGFVVGRLDARHPTLRAFLGTGVLGGFTTYSAFAVQTGEVFGAAPIVGLLLALVSVVAGVAAAAGGLLLGRGGEAAPRPLPAPEEAE